MIRVWDCWEYFLVYRRVGHVSPCEERALSSSEWNKRAFAYRSLLQKRKRHLVIVLLPCIHICFLSPQRGVAFV